MDKQKLLDLCTLLPTHLEEFTITDCENFDNEVLQNLKWRCPHLQLLNISNCTQISAIHMPKQLIVLDMSGTQIDDNALVFFDRKNLVDISLANTKISNTGLASIVKNCSEKLETLNIENCDGITELNIEFPKLQRLGIYGTSIPSASYSKKMLQLPNYQGRPILLQTIVKETAQELTKNLLKKITGDKNFDILELQESYEGNTALHMACGLKGKEDIALELIENMSSESLGLQNFLGDTALHKCCQKYRRKKLKKDFKEFIIPSKANTILSTLIQKMSSYAIGLQDQNGNTALHWLCFSKLQKDLALELIEKMNPQALELQNIKKETVLHWACRAGEAFNEVISALIQKMSSYAIGLQDQNGNTALHWLCFLKLQKDLALELIEKMNPQALELQNIKKETVLHLAVNTGLREVALALIKKMSMHSLDVQDQDENTALHLACTNGYGDIALELVEKMSSKSLELQGKKEKMALWLAIDNELNQVALKLIEKMSSDALQIQNKRKNTVLHLACAKKNEDLALALIEKMDKEALALGNSQAGTVLHWAIFKDLKKVAFALIKKMADDALDVQDEDGNTALHLACLKKQEDIALDLIARMTSKASMLKNNQTNTAKDLAIKNNLSKVVKALNK